MKTNLLALVFTLGAAAVSADVAAPDPARIDEIAAWLPETPTLGGARISDRATWTRLAGLKDAPDVIRRAEKLLAASVPACPDEWYLDFSRNGNRTRYQKPYFARTTALEDMLFAECAENRGRFLPKITAYLEAILAERSWVMPAHDYKLQVFKGEKCYVDLGSGDRTLVLAFVVDWLGERLDPALVARIRAEADRRTFQPYLATARNPARRDPDHWWYYAEMNWNSVCNATVVRAALALVQDRRVRAEFVESAERAAPVALAGYTADGYCTEGMGYWNYGWGHQLMLGLAVRDATAGRVDLFTDPKCRKVQEYAYGFQVQEGLSPHFADGGGNASAVLLALGRRVWPDLCNAKALAAPAFSGGPDHYALRLFCPEPPPAGAACDRLPVRTEFPCAQVYLMRPDPAAKGPLFGVAVKGGHNAELHNHNDLGSYSLVLDGEVMAGDPGGEVYTRETFNKMRYTHPVLGSYGHPVPYLAGREQKDGRAYAAKILSTSFTPARDTVVVDITKAYPVPELKSLVRTFVYDRAARAFTVTDKIAFTKPCVCEFPTITYASVRADYTPGRFTFVGAKNRTLHVSFSGTGGDWKMKSELVPNPLKDSPKRLALAFVNPVTEAEVTVRFALAKEK